MSGQVRQRFCIIAHAKTLYHRSQPQSSLRTGEQLCPVPQEHSREYTKRNKNSSVKAEEQDLCRRERVVMRWT